MSYGAGGWDVYLIKTDTGGNQQWYRTFGGSSHDEGYSVQQTDDLGYIIAGNTVSYGAGDYDVYLIRVESETEQLSVTLSPINPPIIIPAGGGSFQFTTVINNLGLGPTVFDAWFNVSVPEIGTIYLMTRSNIYLSTGGSLTHTLTQYVPSRAPAGTYTYRGFVGEYPDFVVDCDSFTFEKSSTARGFNQYPDWTLEGWDDAEKSSSFLSPLAFNLVSASPNPFNAETRIKFQIPVTGNVSLIVYDIEGKEVCRLVDGWKNAGLCEVEFNGEGLSSGVYLVRLNTGRLSNTEKVVLIK
jgi:hypothetical protein